MEVDIQQAPEFHNFEEDTWMRIIANLTSSLHSCKATLGVICLCKIRLLQRQCAVYFFCWNRRLQKVENVRFTQVQQERNGSIMLCIYSVYNGVLLTGSKATLLLNWNTLNFSSCRKPMWPCLSILSWGISYVNWSWKPDFAYWITVMCLRYYEMGFLPMLKETADVSVPLWYEKFNLKGWEKEWCTAYFHSPTPRDMRMMFCCVQEMMPIVLRRNSFIIQFNFF